MQTTVFQAPLILVLIFARPDAMEAGNRFLSLFWVANQIPLAFDASELRHRLQGDGRVIGHD